MTLLSDLPDVLLQEIFYYFEDDRATLLSASYACRRLHLNSRDILFRHVGGLSEPAQLLLQRSFSNNPDISVIESEAVERSHLESFAN